LVYTTPTSLPDARDNEWVIEVVVCTMNKKSVVRVSKTNFAAPTPVSAETFVRVLSRQHVWIVSTGLASHEKS
jgi:hypothetical protein